MWFVDCCLCLWRGKLGTLRRYRKLCHTRRRLCNVEQHPALRRLASLNLSGTPIADA
eukprot:COSAG01_NODE_60066_length_296_cov_1.725888_1_plen_56_part_10